jgi:LysM repeat protein
VNSQRLPWSRHVRRYLILLSYLLLVILVWQRSWYTPEKVAFDLQRELIAVGPASLAAAIPAPQPTPIPSDRVILVNAEVIQHPQSEAFTADLYVTSTLDTVIPWPNVGGRTAIITHTVESGDTGWGLVYQYGIDLNTLVWANPELDPANPVFSIGQQIRILPVQGVYHVVVEGETVEQIAARYGVPVTNITNYPPNHLTRSYTLQNGQGLIVPYGRQPALDGTIPPLTVDTPLTWPLIGLISQGFNAEAHPGLTINAPEGSPVQAAAAGTVKSVSDNQGGFIVVIDHADELQSWYGHLYTTTLQVGATVTPGQIMGVVGGTDSTATGSYLYFAVYQNELPVDPLAYLPGAATKTE